ncbi:hypothetical protein WN943_024719 [Citrus x changshan-huyou]
MPMPQRTNSQRYAGDEDENTMHTSYDPDKDQGNLDGNPLMVPLDDGIGPTQEEITNKWFG